MSSLSICTNPCSRVNNLASRLEGQSKAYGVPVVLGSRTADYARDDFAILELDLLKVMGKTEPELVYALLGDAALARDAAFAALVERNNDMLARYRARDWTGALEAAAACRRLDPNLGLYELYDLYERRIRAFQADPPPPDWGGIFDAEFK